MTVGKALAKSAKEARLLGSVGDSKDGKREPNDFYPTPPYATEALLSVEKFGRCIWEPACGDGAMSKVLEKAGYLVTSTDLVDRGYGSPRVDFLMEYGVAGPADIVTNPPFKLLVPFIRKACELTYGKVAMLARISALEGLERRKMFEETPFARVWVFSRRLTFKRGETTTHGGGMLSFAWYIWDRDHEGPPTIGWL